jgi:hypothetical protein
MRKPPITASFVRTVLLPQPASVLGGLLMFMTAVSVLLTSDAFEFSWRYQLPALVTLAPAGALGVTVVCSWLTYRSDAGGHVGRKRSWEI